MSDTELNKDGNMAAGSSAKGSAECEAEIVESYQKCLRSFKTAMDAYQAHYNIVVENGFSPESRIEKMQLFHEGMHVMYQELQDQGRDFGYTERESDGAKTAASQLLKSTSGLF